MEVVTDVFLHFLNESNHQKRTGTWFYHLLEADLNASLQTIVKKYIYRLC